ncbi:DUF2147 domain-containing protein [Croceicoccus mobilis]|uniref:DUF2147 domain-containing protein n=1 Tax=Croceicoccus mobilis TaxID=1703339 RepID=A0A916Z432_9SPHN|nr:DUF2147 domain-containing protein [Croceicoccus mobilis]GGD75864.1 hypothetical protein GCM10010990_26830 [Croceicoccus mobilis]
MSIMLALLAAGPALGANDVIGRWKTESRGGVVEITRCGESICGKLVSSEGLKSNPQLTDQNNKDEALRNRRLMNLTILKGFDWKKNSWSGGTIYNAQDGGTYKATVTLEDKDHLKLKGCIVWPLCKTQEWTRIR